MGNSIISYRAYLPRNVEDETRASRVEDKSHASPPTSREKHNDDSIAGDLNKLWPCKLMSHKVLDKVDERGELVHQHDHNLLCFLHWFNCITWLYQWDNATATFKRKAVDIRIKQEPENAVTTDVFPDYMLATFVIRQMPWWQLLYGMKQRLNLPLCCCLTVIA